MPTVSIKEVADKCGVSVSTVSRAMNNRSEVSPETREKILFAAEELGYVPNANARGLKISDLQTVSVVIQGRTSELLIEILGHLQESLSTLGLDVFLQHVPDEEVSLQTLTQMINERRPAGVVFLGRFGATDSSNGDEINRAIEDFTVPVIFCTATPAAGVQSRHSAISVDDLSGAKTLTKLLIDRGHTRIAFGAAQRGEALEGQDVWATRFRGYREALEEANLELDPTLIIPATDNVDIYSAATGYASVANWLESSSPDFTAIVTSCDAVGLGTVRALRDHGHSIPDDIEITAFDGLELSEYAIPSLTTIVQPLGKIAAASAEIIFDAVTNPEHAPTWQLIEGTVRLGESTQGSRR